MNLSVSALSSYLYCPRKLFLEKVLGIKEPPKKALALGSLRHHFYEAVIKKEEHLVTAIDEQLSQREFEDMYREFYTKFLRVSVLKFKHHLNEFGVDKADLFQTLKTSIELDSAVRAKQVFDCQQETQTVGQDLWDAITPKILSELRITSPTLKIIGIIDRIEKHDNILLPVEYKTGSAPKEGVWPGHRIQVAAYAMLLEEKFQTSISHAMVHYLDAQESRKIMINPFMKDEIRELNAKVRQLLAQNYLPDILKNTAKCSKCGVREKCHNSDKMNDLLTTTLQNANSKDLNIT